MEPALFPQLSKLKALRGNPIILYATMINDESVCILYECLKRLGRTDRLDFVLSTVGGIVTATRQLALLLREYTEYLTILVPYKARSAGTLLCLSANKVVLGPLSGLGPLDSHIGLDSSVQPDDLPSMISIQDIRAFRQMAEDWFGVSREEDRLQVLALIAQRIFPTSLSSFYRADQLIRQIAYELLEYQLPNAEASTRQQIVDQLVGGYHAHDYILTRRDARELGLQVLFTSPEEEILLWDLLQACRAQISKRPIQAEQGVVGLIASLNFSAREVVRWIGVPKEQGGGIQQMGRRDIRWEIDT
jgi:hypothetical protein